MIRRPPRATRSPYTALFRSRDEASAAALARSVVGSNLVKAAVFGWDANWGRVLCAMGYSGVSFDSGGVELWFGSVKVFEGGEPAEHEREAANAALGSDEVRITARLGEEIGRASCRERV